MHGEAYGMRATGSNNRVCKVVKNLYEHHSGRVLATCTHHISTQLAGHTDGECLVSQWLRPACIYQTLPMFPNNHTWFPIPRMEHSPRGKQHPPLTSAGTSGSPHIRKQTSNILEIKSGPLSLLIFLAQLGNPPVSHITFIRLKRLAFNHDPPSVWGF